MKIGIPRQPERRREQKFIVDAIVIDVLVGIGVSVSANLIYDALRKVFAKKNTSFKVIEQEDEDGNRIYIIEEGQ